MVNVKRTFTLPDSISEELDAVIPNRQRSKFIAAVLQKALRSRKQDNLMQLLENMPRNSKPDGILAEDVLHEMRQKRAQEILDHSRS